MTKPTGCVRALCASRGDCEPVRGSPDRTGIQFVTGRHFRQDFKGFPRDFS
jgi:hypothetical protein